MAYFAQLDADNIVTRVIVCDSAVLCTRLFGGRWSETKIGVNYAGIGYMYHLDHKAFSPPQRFPSWTLSADKTTWVPPIVRPVGIDIRWDEQANAWISRDPTAPR